MHKYLTRFFLGFLALLAGSAAMAQQATEEAPQMADLLHRNGKIYSVVAVVLVILTGIFLYLWRLDRKIQKLEKNS